MRTHHLLGVLLLLAGACADKKSSEDKEATTLAPVKVEATSSAAKAPPPPPANDQVIALKGLGLTLKAPECAIAKVDEEQRAMLMPVDPACRVLPLMGVEIRDAAIDFAEDKAVISAETLLGGSDVTHSKTDDGYRVDFTTQRGRGLIIAHAFADRTINCRGTGSPEQVQTIEAICTSLAAGE